MTSKHFNLRDIKENRRLTTWWTLLLDPPAIAITWLLVNFTHISPNIVTLLGLGIGFIANYFIYQNALVMAAILFEIYYVFDMVDGRIARLTNSSSDKGMLLDFLGDRILYFSLASFLFLYSINSLEYRQASVVIISFIFLENFNLLTSTKIKQTFKSSKSSRISKKDSKQELTFRIRVIKRVRSIKSKYNVPIIPGGIEAVHIAFFLGPISGQIFWGFVFGNLIILFTLCSNVIFLPSMKHE